MAINLLNLYAEHFPRTFLDHAQRLEYDARYREEFQQFVRQIGEKHWLQCPKWRLTSRLMRTVRPACESCGDNKMLNVHHKTYEHLGIEILYPEDLEVLCRVCHVFRHVEQQMTLPLDQRRNGLHL